MKSSLAQQLSCCTCQGGAESADGSWGISYCWWWNHSLDPPWGYHVGLCSDVGRRMRCTAPQHCRKAWGKQLTGTEQHSTQCSVWNSHKCPANTANKLKVKATIEVWVHAKGPSHCVSCESSTALWLFKQWTALLQTINCRKVWGKQPTGTEEAPLSLFGMKFTRVPGKNTATD
jgi:hypothetical protein